MLDKYLRRLIDPPLDRLARDALRAGFTADRVTLASALCGLICFAFLALQSYGAAMAALLLARGLDGLDGAIARQSAAGPTDRGAFFDSVNDFIFYAGFPFFFAAGQAGAALAAAFLIFCFMGTASSFFAYAVIAAKRGINHEENGRKSFFHLQGLTEGTETIAAFVLMCLVPAHFNVIAVLFGLMCLFTAAARVRQGWQDFQ